MALLTITGYPSSGKSTRAQELAALLSGSNEIQANNLSTCLLSELQFGFNPEITPLDFRKEKVVRTSLLSATERNLTKNNIVIVDSSNELKSMRYQLACLAKAMAYPQLVFHISTSETECRKWNAKRHSESLLAYSDAAMTELISRYEFPNPSVKWDSPLWVINPQDEFPIPDLIKLILSSRKATTKKTHVPTQPKSHSEGNYLQAVNMVVNSLIQTLEESFKNGERDPILPSILQRKKKEFLHQLRLNPISIEAHSDNAKLKSAFLDYVYL